MNLAEPAGGQYSPRSNQFPTTSYQMNVLSVDFVHFFLLGGVGGGGGGLGRLQDWCSVEVQMGVSAIMKQDDKSLGMAATLRIARRLCPNKYIGLTMKP